MKLCTSSFNPCEDVLHTPFWSEPKMSGGSSFMFYNFKVHYIEVHMYITKVKKEIVNFYKMYTCSVY